MTISLQIPKKMRGVILLLSATIIWCSSIKSGSDHKLGNELLRKSEQLQNLYWHEEVHDPEATKKLINEMKELIKAGADVNIVDDSDRRPSWVLMNLRYLLCEHEDEIGELFDLLAQAGAKTYLKKASVFETPTDCLPEKLFEHGLQTMPGDNSLLNGFFYAGYRHQPGDNHEKLKILLKAGLSPLATNEYGFTPLMEAVGLNNVEAVKLFLEHIDKADQKNSKGITALHIAFDGISHRLSPSDVNSKYEIIDALVKKGVSINIVDSEGATPLIYTIKEHDHHDSHLNQRLIDLVIALGADPLQKDGYGLSALHYAHHKGLHKLITALLMAIEKYAPEKLTAAQTESMMNVSQGDTFLGSIRYGAFDMIIIARKFLAVIGFAKVLWLIKQQCTKKLLARQ